jgi:hypothetical protein
MVYSRATTSAMALRPVLPADFLPVFAEGAIFCGVVVSCCSKLNIVADRDARAHEMLSMERNATTVAKGKQLYVLTEFLAVG